MRLRRVEGAPADHAPRVGKRFENPDHARRPPARALLRWMLGLGPRDDHDRRPRWSRIPQVAVEPAALRSRDRDGVTWLGHATALVHLRSVRALIDPIWNGTIGLRRASAPPLPLDRLPALDLVLVTHDHHDHLEAAAARALPPDVPFIVPAGLGGLLRRWGRHVVELDWWDRVDLEHASVTFVPAQHWSRRGLTDENRSLWGGFLIQSDRHSVYCSGDSGWFDGFAEIGRRGRPTVALLPIGAYAPRWFMRMQHIDPAEALDALEALGARSLLPVHWGTFSLSDEPLGEPPALLEQLARARGLERRIVAWPIGGTQWL